MHGIDCAVKGCSAALRLPTTVWLAAAAAAGQRRSSGDVGCPDSLPLPFLSPTYTPVQQGGGHDPSPYVERICSTLGG